MQLRRLTSLLLVALCAPAAQGAITNWTCGSDGAIAITTTPTWYDFGSNTYYLSIADTQSSSPAHLNGTFVTDAPTDTSVTILQNLKNQTGMTWTSYHIDIGMTDSFSIVGVVTPFDWTWVITPPEPGQSLPGSPSPGTGTVGAVDFYAGTPIGVGQSGAFGIDISFQGSRDFYTAQVPLPEPTSAVILAAGVLFLLRPRRAAANSDSPN